MNRQEWLAKRRQGIGGSDIAAIVGESPWGTPLSVFMDKIGLSEEKAETPEQKRGRILEGYVANMYQEETGKNVYPGKFLTGDNPLILGTPDRFVGSEKGLEIKTSRNDKGWGEAGTDQVPLYYSLQSHWYLVLCPDFNEWDLAALLGIDDFRIYTIKRDVELEGLLVQEAEKFWKDHVLTGIPPDLTKASPYQVKNYLKAKYQNHGSEVLPMESEALEYLLKLEEWQKISDNAEMHLETFKNYLKVIIGDHAGIEGDGFKATWKQTKPSEKTDWEAIARELKASDELIKDFTKKKPGPRKFLWSHKEEK